MKIDTQDQIIFLILHDTRYKSPTVSDYELSDFLISRHLIFHFIIRRLFVIYSE